MRRNWLDKFKISVVNYAGRSIGGSGYFLIIWISNPEKHTAHFKHIKNYLKKSYDINVDEGAILKHRVTPASLVPFTLLWFEKLNLPHIKTKV